VIASKINFTRKTGDLLKFISSENLQARYGGKDTWEYRYIEPIPGENAKLDAAEKRAEIQKQREELIGDFERETAQWASLGADQPVANEKQLERSKIAGLLRATYWTLDPYIRATTYYHRAGVVDTDGRVDFKAAN
jgi:hypothetical protein